MKWNLADYGGKWIIETESVNEIRCIHTVQGLEVDYTHVIQYAIQTAREQNCAMITLQASEMELGLDEKMGFERDYAVYNYV